MNPPKPPVCFSCHEKNSENNLVILKKVKVNGEPKEMCGDCYNGFLIVRAEKEAISEDRLKKNAPRWSQTKEKEKEVV